MKKIIFGLLVLLLVSSCATVKLKDLQIKSADVAFVEFLSGEEVDTIIPGNGYGLRIIVTDENGKTHSLPINHPDISVTFRNDCFSRGIFGSLIATQNTFRLLNTGKYQAEVEFLVNEHPPVSTEGIIGFTEISSIDFNGWDGHDGSDGQDGRDGNDYNEYDLDGDDGSNGSDGSNGYDAENLEFVIFNYKFAADTIDPMLFFVLIEVTTNTAMILPKKSLLLSANGGAGGKGGDGGAAGSAGTYRDHNTNSSETGRAGSPGGPGSGGDGGDGGHITVYYSHETLLDLLSFSVEGGRGGDPGRPGRQASYGGGYSSSFAINGNYGRDGSVTTTFITKEQLEELLSTVNVPELDIDRIVW